ncbi:MAG: iron ABC transporter permease [Gammaproteobacteria bacterium]|nr:MAG: iron ABC transporter permease [Gammaproteobacteria bacterium]
MSQADTTTTKGRLNASQSHGLWYAVAGFAALLILIPILSIIVKAASADSNIWPHLSRTMLPLYIEQTATLMLGVGALSTLLGVGSAYIVARYAFAGRRVLEWALILPLAVPTYLVAYVYTDLLEYAGPVQRLIRATFGFHDSRDYAFFEIRSMGGAVTTLSLVLYPYVYLLARAAFLEQSQNILESSRVLGAGRFKTFWRVTLPLARPAIIVGVMLVLMEVLNDFGAVHHFAIQTFSEGIYDYWLGRSNIEGASQIALMMLSLIVVLMAAEQFSRRQQALFQKSNPRQAPRRPLSKRWTWTVVSICALPVIFGFVVPIGRLLFFAIYFEIEQAKGVWQMAWNSLALSATAAILTGLLAVFVAYARRRVNTPLVHGLGIASGLGYAIPGAVLAIGVLVPFGLLDRTINDIAEAWTGERVGLIFSGTIAIMVVAYMVRFMSIAQGSIYAGLQKITPSMDQSAQTLGCNNVQIIRRVHLPLLHKSILTAMLIVFVDSMKELPATLILRPFNFDTLATNVYQYASDELLEEASLAALMIIVVGLLPIIWLNRSISRET